MHDVHSRIWMPVGPVSAGRSETAQVKRTVANATNEVAGKEKSLEVLRSLVFVRAIVHARLGGHRGQGCEARRRSSEYVQRRWL